MSLNNNETEIDSLAKLIELLQSSKIFADIDYKVCEALLPTLERVFLPQGETLFEQGDPSDSLYILIDGQLLGCLLATEGKYKIVGAIEKGETVGEFGAFSHQPRSLTVKAAVDSRLLKFTSEQFQFFCKQQPNFISHIVELIIERSQHTLKLISQKKMFRHIAIVKANDDVPIQQFIQKIKQNFTEDPKYFFLDKLPKGLTLANFIAQAERNNNVVVFVLDEARFQGVQTKINNIGGVFVVADGDSPPAFSEFALKMLSRQQTPFATQYDLVLLHGDQVTLPSGTQEWLKESDFTLHHHIRLNKNSDYQRLLRFMFGKAVGLVLGGGGHKGWATVGALKALLESDVPIDAVGGTSVGAIVGACYALHLNFEDTYAAYKQLANSATKPLSLKNWTWPLISLISSKAPTESLWKALGEVKIEDLWIPYFSVSCNLTQGKEVVHNSGVLWEKVRASAALPGIVPPVVMDGELFYDGGLLNNLPVDHMQEVLGSDGVTIGVTLSGTIISKKRYHFPPIVPFRVGLLKRLGLGYKEYKFPPFFHTFMRAMLVGSSAKEKANQLLADVIISPDMRNYHVLKLNLKAVEAMVQSGYSEAKEKLQNSKIFSRETEAQ